MGATQSQAVKMFNCKPENWFLVEHHDFRVHIVIPYLGISNVVKNYTRIVVGQSTEE